MRSLKVLMFGWEFPPKNSGGLGTACYGLTKALARNNVQITLVLPYDIDTSSHDFLKIVSSPNIKIRKVKSVLMPYISSSEYNTLISRQNGKGANTIYGKNLFEEVNRYAELAVEIAQDEDFDVIHCHDWMTFKAGMNVKKLTGKPLIVHVHSIEFDRTGGNGFNPFVWEIEKCGMENADFVLPVSNYTKRLIMQHYGIPEDKIVVVHNAIDNDGEVMGYLHHKLREGNKIVLFLGRITLQKGPDYFIYAAKKALEIDPNIIFVVAGKGDMETRMIDKVAEMGIGDKVLFTGFLSGKNIDEIYKMADLYVMPSVSEPFGLTCLESMKNGTPVLISKQSGVSEVVNHCLKADFWDVNQITNKMLSVLKHDELRDEMRTNGFHEVKKFSWDCPAKKCIEVYKRALHWI